MKLFESLAVFGAVILVLLVYTEGYRQDTKNYISVDASQIKSPLNHFWKSTGFWFTLFFIYLYI